MSEILSKTIKIAPQCRYKPEYCELLEKHMAKGYSFEAFGGRIKVDRQTLYNWCSVFPEFQAAKNRGVEASRFLLEKRLMQITKTGKGHIVGAIFLLKNKFPNDWRDRKELEIQKEEVKENLTLDEQIAKVELMRAQLLQLKESQEQQDIKTIEA